MLRRSASILQLLSKVPACRKYFIRHQQRLLQFTMSHLVSSFGSLENVMGCKEMNMPEVKAVWEVAGSFCGMSKLACKLSEFKCRLSESVPWLVWNYLKKGLQTVREAFFFRKSVNVVVDKSIISSYILCIIVINVVHTTNSSYMTLYKYNLFPSIYIFFPVPQYCMV